LSLGGSAGLQPCENITEQGGGFSPRDMLFNPSNPRAKICQVHNASIPLFINNIPTPNH
jgi:hypothetical protein